MRLVRCLWFWGLGSGRLHAMVAAWRDSGWAISALPVRQMAATATVEERGVILSFWAAGLQSTVGYAMCGLFDREAAKGTVSPYPIRSDPARAWL